MAMQFDIEAPALINALASVRGCVERRTTIPILEHVLLVASDSGLSIRGTDLTCEALSRAEAEVAVPGATAVNAQALFSLVSALPKGAILSIDLDGDILTIKAGRARYKLQTLSPKDFPEQKTVEGVTFSVDPSVFGALLDATLPSVSTDETRYYLCGVYVHCLNGNLVAVSTDGHRLSRRTMPLPDGAGDIPDIIIPTKGARLMAGLLGKASTATINISPSRVMITVGDTTFVTQTIDGKYPDYQRAIPSYDAPSFAADGPSIAAVADRSKGACSGGVKAEPVRLRVAVDRGEASLSATHNGIEAVHESIEAETVGADVFVGLNADYLSTAMGVFGDERVNVHIAGSSAPVVFTSDAIPSQTFVVMPIRL